MSGRILLDRLEFYITNVCNLTCSGCNRYNNYKFSGTQRWADYADTLSVWSKYIDIRHPVILGGEPLLNPDIVQWIRGLRTLWGRHSGVQVQSNGTRIDQVPGLYDAVDHDNWIGISIHRHDDKEALFAKIRNFLKPPIRESSDKSHPIGSDYQFYDVNNKYVHAWLSGDFVQSNIVEHPDGTFGLYDSDPVKAHENCTFRRFRNYHMINGKIYKCGPAALMPEFDQQYGFNLSDYNRDILHGYRPLSIDDVAQRGEEFFNSIDEVIPQCKFCPEQYHYRPIQFTSLKKPWKK